MKSPANPLPTPALALLFFVSGWLALVYEVIWQRQFALLFGSSAPATAAVLAAYFAGLGAGSHVLGRIAGRWQNPLRVYAVLEVLIGVGVLLVTPIQRLFEGFYPWLFANFAEQEELFFLAKLTLVFIALAVPTFCMGGTLPVLGRLVDQGTHRLGITAGLLYVTNTAGAGLGALAVPFLLLPVLGGSNTILLGALGNVLLAVIAWRLTLPSTINVGEKGHPRKPFAATANGSSRSVLMLLALFSGVVTFILQVAWNRAFAQVHENSVHSFAIIAAIVILALALGAQLARVALRRQFDPGRLIGGAWCLAGIAVLTGPWLFLQLTGGLDYLPTHSGWADYVTKLFGLAAAVLLLPTVLLGIAFPAIMEQAGRDEGMEANRAIGRLLAVNVLGAVMGALAAGFLFPRWLGLWHGIMLTGIFLIALGGVKWIKLKHTRARRQAQIIVAMVCLLLVWPVLRVDLPRVRLALDQGERLLAIAEGPHGIATVVERPGSRRLKLNNHYVLGGTAATGDERMQAHVPMLLHPGPKRVAMLGVGSGITAGGAMFHPVEEITAIELVPEVVSFAREHFREANAGVLADPRTTVVAEDARNFLRGSGQVFDVIIGDLVVPWRQGEGALFTLEQFQAARDALAPGGLFCQWLPLFQLSETEADILVRTFLTVFPQATAWRGDFSPSESAVALVAWKEAGPGDAETLRARLVEMRPDPANPHLRDPVVLWMHYLGRVEAGGFSGGEARVNRDDQPLIELLGPLRHSTAAGVSELSGRKLQTWLKKLAVRDPDELGQLTVDERNAVQAGDVFAEMLLRASERNFAGAREAQAQLQELLPASIYQQLFP